MGTETKKREILTALVESYPDTVGRDYLSEATGYKRSSRDTYLQRLRSRKLIVVSADGVAASEQLFD